MFVVPLLSRLQNDLVSLFSKGSSLAAAKQCQDAGERTRTASTDASMKAIDALVQAGVLQEITGKPRDRVYAYRGYLGVLGEDTEIGVAPSSTDRTRRLTASTNSRGKKRR